VFLLTSQSVGKDLALLQADFKRNIGCLCSEIIMGVGDVFGCWGLVLF